MAKPATVKIKLVSTADTGFFYVTKKNPRTQTEKMVMRKYDPKVRKHVEFKESKIKRRAEGSPSPLSFPRRPLRRDPAHHRLRSPNPRYRLSPTRARSLRRAA